MGIGASIFLIAVGAIFAFAVNTPSRGVDLNMVGVILMIVGGLGLFLSVLFWYSWPVEHEEVIRERDIHDHHRHAL